MGERFTDAQVIGHWFGAFVYVDDVLKNAKRCVQEELVSQEQAVRVLSRMYQQAPEASAEMLNRQSTQVEA